jgi:hypothetical protein
MAFIKPLPSQKDFYYSLGEGLHVLRYYAALAMLFFLIFQVLPFDDFCSWSCLMVLVCHYVVSGASFGNTKGAVLRLTEALILRSHGGTLQNTETMPFKELLLFLPSHTL